MSIYDTEAYPFRIRNFSHPSRLATVATLAGCETVPVGSCRVLEIGGGNGINVINMAALAPGSEFFNFDLSSVAIAEGQALVAEAGLTNIRMEAMDILQAGPELGMFDYIIVHGVYAWVPRPVREALMALMGRILSPRGIALVSYNAFPGCHIREAVRDLVYRVTRSHERSEDRIRAAQSALSFFSKHWDRKDAQQASLLIEADRILEGDPQVLFHDELSDDWHPQFVADVISAARQSGLDYLGDTQLSIIKQMLFPEAFALEAETLSGGDPAALELLRDYRDVRSFRITLLRRAGERLEPRFRPERVAGLYVEGQFAVLPESERSGKPFGFKSQNGVEICTADERLANLCQRLNEAWPQAIPVEDVAQDDDSREAVARLFCEGAVGLTTEPHPLATRISERPVAFSLARVLAARGLLDVPTLKHTQARLDGDTAAKFLLALDGTRDRGAILDYMRGLVSEDDATLARNVDKLLQDFLLMGLLEA